MFIQLYGHFLRLYLVYYYVQWSSLCVLLMNVSGVGQNVKKTTFEYTFFQYSYVFSIFPYNVVGINVLCHFFKIKLKCYI